ncbi:hypothetical protein ACB094_09G071900 [Castanea mollissima]
MCMSSYLKSTTVPVFANETDHLALLDFKNRITQDLLQIMSSWNDSIHFCNWLGVTCGPSRKRDIALNLTAKKLSCSIPPSIGNLTYLTSIDLQHNSFYGEIPQEVGHLQHLQHVNLSGNSFGGKLPTNLNHLSSLSKLVYLELGMNNLTGNILAWIGNFSSLYALGLCRNNFQGSIPSELGGLTGLVIFRLGVNNLSGTIPHPIYNISSIYIFSVTQNWLHGSLPPDVGLTLPNLQLFYCAINNFTGSIPASLSNASQAISENGLIGTIPQILAGLQSLVRLYFGGNRLGYGKDGDLNFLSFLANCTSLKLLDLSYNYFGGVLPNSIANLSTQLHTLTLHVNMIRGDIPIGIGNLVNLELLGLCFNYLGGTLPHVLGKLQKLYGLYLNNNKFSGPIPSSLGNSTTLTKLYIEGNRFEGRISLSLGNLQNLFLLDISNNNLIGTIPKHVIGLSSLSISLDMSHNFLIGTLPFEVGNLIHLIELDLSNNRLSGKIPSTLETCQSSERLYLEGNSFEGAIPQSLETLKELHLPTCARRNLCSSGRLIALKIVILITSMVIFVLDLLERALTTSSFEDRKLLVSYAELLKSTNGFSENNLIGSSSFGLVYKGVLFGNGATTAIKVLNLQKQGASKSFINECNALRSVRHRNLLKIIFACSTTNYERNDFKSLIFEFMCNGIVHCDLKPSNILLEEDMVAHVGDFGCMKYLFKESNNPSKAQILSIELKGSIGYTPLGDIYSYGILSLELFTRKRPIDEMFKDGMSIHKFIAMALLEYAIDILDPLMFFGEDNEDVNDDKHKDDIDERATIKDHHVNASKRIKDCFISVFRIGLLCSTTSRDEQVPMNVVINKMNAIRDTFLKFKMGNKRRKRQVR